MNIELHILQNFAPSNLNRDDTGSPKSCRFGDYDRARVSSQALKRATRNYIRDRGLLSKDELGHRSKKFKKELVKRLSQAKIGFVEEHLPLIADAAIRSLDVKIGKDDLTAYLLFLSEAELNNWIKTCKDNQPALEEYASFVIEKQSKKKGKADKTDNEQVDEEQEKKEIKLPKELKNKIDEVQKEFQKALDLKQAADIAMFGRMLADLPDKNRVAASQVAHAISTHEVSEAEFDYFTAVEDLAEFGEQGAPHIGETEFNSACYYRYTNICGTQLWDKNLNKNTALAKRTLEAFLRAFVCAVPSGKQNSFASPTPPSLVLIVLRDGDLCSLANAFEQPISRKERDEHGIVGSSIRRLLDRLYRLEKMYGEFNGARQIFISTDAEEHLEIYSQLAGLEHLKDKFALRKVEASDNGDKRQEAVVYSLPQLIQKVVAEVFPDESQKGEGV